MIKSAFALANNRGTDQPVHPHSLISAFVVHCLDSIISLVFISEISGLYLASLAAQAGLCLTWTQTPKTDFLITRLSYESEKSKIMVRMAVIKDHFSFKSRLYKFVTINRY